MCTTFCVWHARNLFYPCSYVFLGTMVNPGGSSQPPPVGTGSLSWKRCAGCGGKIADRFLLYTMDSYWHSRCLKCSCCQAQLGEIGTSCYTKSGMILCRNDYIRWGNEVCAMDALLSWALIIRLLIDIYRDNLNERLDYLFCILYDCPTKKCTSENRNTKPILLKCSEIN